MKRKIVAILALSATIFVFGDSPFAPAGGKKSDGVVKAKAKLENIGGKAVVVINLEINKGWHLYANPVGNDDLAPSQTTVKISAKTAPKSVNIDYPLGKIVNDKVLGNYGVYEGKVEIRATVERAAGDAGPLEVTVRVQACDDKTCLPPGSIRLSVP